MIAKGQQYTSQFSVRKYDESVVLSDVEVFQFVNLFSDFLPEETVFHKAGRVFQSHFKCTILPMKNVNLDYNFIHIFTLITFSFLNGRKKYS